MLLNEPAPTVALLPPPIFTPLDLPLDRLADEVRAILILC